MRISDVIPLMRALRQYQCRTYIGLKGGIENERGVTFTVMYPRQAGKNELAAVMIAGKLFAHALSGGWVIVCAPSFRPQVEISMDRVKDWVRFEFGRIGRHANPRVSDHTISVGNAAAVFLTAAPDAHVAGHTASLLLVGDEAQDIDRAWFERQFRPMTATTGAPTVLFGTPWTGNSLFEETALHNRLEDERDPGRRPRHFEVTWEEVAEALPRYGAFVASERERLGPSSPFFRTQYELRTVEESGRLLPEALVRSLEGIHPRLPGPLPGDRYVAGLDLGGDTARADASVLVVGRVLEGDRCEVVQILSWQGVDGTVVEAAIAEVATHWRFERLCIDGTGLGQRTAAVLESRLGGVAERVVFTAATKSILGLGLIQYASTGRLALFRHDRSAELDALYSELRSCAITFRQGGQLGWGDDRGHDDHAIALSLCLRACTQAGGPRVAMGRRR